MKVSLFIKKVELKELSDQQYWGSFERLFELSQTEDQYFYFKLLEFFQSIVEYKAFIEENFPSREGTSKVIPPVPNSKEVFYIFVLRDKSYYPVARGADPFLIYAAKRDALFESLGWIQKEEKVLDFDLEFNEEKFEWIGVPTDYNELNKLYNSAVTVSEYLGS